MQDQVVRLTALLEQRAAPSPAPLTLVPSDPPKPLLEKRVEDAITARAFDPQAERLSRQYALQMAARGIPADQIAATIRRGSVPRETVDAELSQVVA